MSEDRTWVEKRRAARKIAKQKKDQLNKLAKVEASTEARTWRMGLSAADGETN